MWYLNNSKIFEDGNSSSPGSPRIYKEDPYVQLHLIPCNKAALICFTDLATQYYNTLQLLQTPVYFGKDVIAESWDGYTFDEYFPTYFY